MNIIELQNITKTYYPGKVAVPVLKNISLTIRETEFVAIMGASGSGKSTLLYLLGLLDKPTSGNYFLAGQNTIQLSDVELAIWRNRFIGFVFQQFNLLPRMSARENVSMPLVYSDNPQNNRDIDLLEKVGMGHRINYRPNELSGGQQQRVAIARALINQPKLILADEPTGNLDSHSAQEILQILKDLNKSGITIVMVTHEKNLAAAAERIITLQDGEIISDTRSHQQTVSLPEKTELPEVTKKVVGREKLEIFNWRKISNYFTQAFRSLLANRTRSFLSILGVLIGVACVITMLALGTGAREDVQKRLASLGSNLLIVRPGGVRVGGVALGTGVVTRLTREDIAAIEKIPGVSKVVGHVSGRGQIVYNGKNWNTSIDGTTADYPDIRNAHPEQGRFFTETEVISRAKLCLLGKTVVRELFSDQNPIGEFIKINRIDFQVIGVLPTKGSSGWRDEDDVVVVPLNTAMYRLLGKQYVDSIDVQVASAEIMDDISSQIKKLLLRLHRLTADQTDMIDIRNMAELQQAISGTAKTFSYLLGSIALVSLLVGGVGIMNIMLVSVTERTREIGLRKSLGANNQDILFQFVIESIVICLLGGIFGIILGSGISLLLAKFANWSTKISVLSIILSFSFSVLIGLLFGIWPAKRASQLNPIEALRYE